MKRVIVIVSVLVISVESSWLNDVTSPNGLDFGDGIVVRIDDSKVLNSSFFDRLAVKVDYNDLGISVGRTDNNSVEVDFFMNDKIEGRSKKSDNMVMPFVLGSMGAGTMGLVVAGMKTMVLKSLIIAKMALVFSVVLLVSKLMKNHEDNSYLEVEHHAGSEVYPVYSEYPSDGDIMSASDTMGYNNGGFGGYPYNYGVSSAAESALNYATVEAPANNSVAGVNGMPQVRASKRRDHPKRKAKVPVILSITHYNKSDK